MTPPSPGGSKQNFVLIGVIVGVLVLGVLGFFLARGAGSSPQEKAVLNFVKAAKAKDCEGLIDVMSNDYLRGADRADVIEACKENIDSSSMFEAAEDVDIVSTKLESSTDDTATVIVKSKQDGKTVDEEFDLVLEDGKWRIGDID